jgi:glycosyltransferase involved in cell wall biosynthesis
MSHQYDMIYIMKKIALIYDCIYPYQLGGAEKRIYALSKYLKKDFEVHVIGMHKIGLEKEFEKNKIYYHTLNNYSEIYNKKGKRKILLSIHFAISLFFFLLKNDYDIIDATANPFFHIFSIKLITTIKRKTKVIITWHEYWDKDYWIKYSSKLIGILGFTIQNLALYLSENIVSVSQFTKKRIAKKTNKKVNLISNGIEDIKIKREHKLYDLVYAGRIIDFKNIDKILNLSYLNKNLKTLIIGSGPESERYKEKYKNKNIEFAGFVKKEIDVYKKIAQSRIFMMLSSREGFSIVTLEAMNIGLPVVCFNGKDNAAKDLIENNKNGILTDLKTTNIENSIDIIFQNYENYSKNARKTSYNYLYKNIYKDYFKLINSL